MHPEIRTAPPLNAHHRELTDQTITDRLGRGLARRAKLLENAPQVTNHIDGQQRFS